MNTGIICTALILSLSTAGVSYANWQQGINIRGLIATGKIDPVFNNCRVVSESVCGLAETRVEKNGKTIRISIQEAYPGYFARFRYKVTNKGTVPVLYKTTTGSPPPGIEVKISEPAGVIKGNGDSREGEITIAVNNVEEDCEYEFTTELSFWQWNASK